MAVRDRELLTFNGWPAGMNNRLAEEDLPPDAARLALNVDFTDAGTPDSRRGRSLLKAMPGLHSLWADQPRFPLMLGAYDGNLVAFDRYLNEATVVALADPDAPLSFDIGTDHAYYTNGTDCGRISPAGDRDDWAPERPNGQPDVLPDAAGGMHAGTYQVAITYLDYLGRESGSTLAELVDVAEGGGIRLEHLPQPVAMGINAIRVYCSGADGTELHHVRDLAVGPTTAVFGAHTPGKSLATQFLEPLPPGQIVRFHRGRQFVFAGRRLHWSEALNYGQGNLARNYLGFASNGTLFESTGDGNDDGVHIADKTHTYYMGGDDPKSWRRRRVFEGGAVPGTAVRVEAKKLGLGGAGRVPYWLTTTGQFVLGLPGAVDALHLDSYVAPINATYGSSTLLERRGVRHLVTALRGGEVSEFAMRDSASAEVWRNGVRVS